MENLRTSHQEQIERWAHFVKKNPTKWKAIHTEFINSLFQKHEQFIDKLSKSPQGKEKLNQLYSRNLFKA